MSKRTLLLGITLVGLAATASAQNNPAALRIVVPTPAGSAPDIIARLLGEQLRERLGRTVLIDNKSGAGGIIAVQAVKTAKPDGNTLLFGQAAAVVVTPLTYRAAKYDMDKDFESISVVASTPMLFVANPESGIKSLSEAITRAKSNPDKLTIGSPARGSIPHLSGELLDQRSGARFNNVPMSNSAQAVQAVVNGDSQLSVDGVAPLLPLIKAGRIKALAVSSDRVLPGLEGIPLASETIPDLKVSGWFMLFAPKGTPKETVDKINAAVEAGIKVPAVVQQMRENGNYPVGGSVADAKAFLLREQKLWSEVTKRAGIEAE